MYSGYETFVKELCERLIKQNVEDTVYCHKNLFIEYPKQINGINLIYLSTIEKKTLSQFIHSFKSILHAVFQKYDLILVVNSANGPFGLITKLFRQRTVINVDGLEWKRPKWEGLGAKYFYLAAKLSTKLYDSIITDSIEMQTIYQGQFNANSTVIAYGANIQYSDHPELIKKWDLEPGQYFLIVARMVPDNNGDLMIREFLASSSPKKLVIVGDVPYEDSYAQNLKGIRDPRLIFTGYILDQKELAELYHNCYVYFHGHEFGGTNPALLKALAYGCAVLALDTVFNRETLDNDKYGLFFNRESGNMRLKISELELNRSLIEKLRKNSRNRIKETYTWEKITRQYLNLFQNLLEGKTDEK